MNQIDPLASKANHPDLDWSQVRETLLMLQLASGQIEAALKDSNVSVAVLTEAFTTMASQIESMGQTIASLPGAAAAGTPKASLQHASGNVANLVNQSIIAFQFYDRMVQRLSHVNHALNLLSELVGDSLRLYNPREWAALQQVIRSKYSMPEEIRMFEAVMAGVPVKDALEQFMNEIKDSTGDIELF